VLAATVVAALAGAAPAAAVDAGSAQGSGGQVLSVSAATGLPAAGTTVVVSGSGYDVRKGVYVAFCVTPPAGRLPSPCGGGADTSGASGGSSWVSSNPPSYGRDLATPYGAGGTFEVKLHVAAALDAKTDCRKVSCSIVTRADHTRTSDRSQDVLVPVSFAGAGSPEDSDALTAVAVSGAGVVVLASAGAVLWALRRRKTVAA